MSAQAAKDEKGLLVLDGARRDGGRIGEFAVEENVDFHVVCRQIGLQERLLRNVEPDGQGMRRVNDVGR